MCLYIIRQTNGLWHGKYMSRFIQNVYIFQAFFYISISGFYFRLKSEKQTELLIRNEERLGVFN